MGSSPTAPGATEAVRVPPAGMPDVSPTGWVQLACVVGAPIMLVALWIGDVIRPGSFARAGKRDVTEHPWYIWLFGAAIVFVAGALGAGLVAGLPAITGGSATDARGQAVVSLAGVVAGLAAGAVMIRLFRASVGPNAGLDVRARHVPRGLVAFLCAIPVVLAVAQLSSWGSLLVTGEKPGRIAHRSLAIIVSDRAGPWSIVLGACAIFGAPIVEEIVYRVFVQSAILRMTGRPWAAVVGAGAVFGGAHLPGGTVPVYAAIPIAILGVSMGIAYERSRSLAVPITMHVLFNALNIVLAVAV